MIKIGVFGLSEETIALIREIKTGKEQVKLGYSLTDILPAQSFLRSDSIISADPEDIIRHSDMLLFSDPDHTRMRFIRMALRASRPLLFISTHHLSQEALHEVVTLAGEAGTPVCCNNPVWDSHTFQHVTRIIPHPAFTEFTYGFQPDLFSPASAVDHLLFTLETTLKLNRSFPRKPVIGAYATGTGKTDMIHVHLTFDNGAVAFLRYHGLSDKKLFTCRMIQNGDIVFANLLTGTLMHQLVTTEGLSPAQYVSQKKVEPSLFHNWKQFISGEKIQGISIEDRLATMNIYPLISEKIMNKTIAGIV